MSEHIDPIEVAVSVVRALESLGIASTVGGSIAASFAGEPRSTVDIDIVAAIEPRHVPELVEALLPDFYVDADALARAARNHGSTNLIHHASSLKVDLFVAGGTPLDALQLSRRQMIQVGGGATLGIHPPEDILLQKLRWFRLGGEVSDRQWRDVVGIVRVQGERLDLDYLQKNAPVLNVADLLERALRERSA
jgi:hypothetical protein